MPLNTNLPSRSFQPRKLLPERDSATKVSTCTQTFEENNPHGSSPLASHQGSPTSAMYQCQKRDASTDPLLSNFQPACVDPSSKGVDESQPGGASAPQILLVDSQHTGKRTMIPVRDRCSTVSWTIGSVWCKRFVARFGTFTVCQILVGCFIALATSRRRLKTPRRFY